MISLGDFSTHHHGDDREEIPVALDSGEAERKHVSEENHGWTEANSTQDLREARGGVRKSDSMAMLGFSGILAAILNE